MKKKLLALVMACSMVFALTACGKDGDDNKKQPETFDVPDVDVPDIDVPDVDLPDTEEPTTEATEAPAASTNEITLAGCVSFSLAGTDYEEYQTSANTNVYAENNSLQTFSITAMDMTGYTPADVESQFVAQIEAVYGTNYVTYDTTFNGIKFTTFYFGTDNIMSKDIEVTCYLHVDKDVVIYSEEAWAVMLNNSSGDTEMVLDTLEIL